MEKFADIGKTINRFRMTSSTQHEDFLNIYFCPFKLGKMETI